jgi:hypothetical protein
VEERLAQRSDGPVHDDVLVDWSLVVPELLPEEAHRSVALPAPVADLPAEEEVSPPQPVRAGARRAANDPGHFGA